METQPLLNRLDSIINDLRQLREVVAFNDVSPVLPASAVDMMAKRICLNCGEAIKPGKRIVRGCHETCTKKVKGEIAAGLITEEMAIFKGLIAPADKGGNKRKKTAIDKIAAGEDIDTAIRETREKYREPFSGPLSEQDEAMLNTPPRGLNQNKGKGNAQNRNSG